MPEIFKKLLPEDRETLLQRAVDEKALFVFKSTQKAIKAKISNLKRPNYICCSRPSDVAMLRTKADVVIVMVLGEERYFFKSFAFVDDDYLFFKRKVDFYQLVRRKNKRFKFPDKFEATLMIKRLNSNLSFLRGIVSDFSDTGCKLSLITSVPEINVGDEVVGNLKMGDKRGLEVSATVRHHEKPKSGTKKQTFGLSFIFPTSHSKNMIKSLFLELQRELFAEFFGNK